jgi:hypothetical protein
MDNDNIDVKTDTMTVDELQIFAILVTENIFQQCLIVVK